MRNTTAHDLLHAMVRIAPQGAPSEAMGLILKGYSQALNGTVGGAEARTRSNAYQRGYFHCNQVSLKPSERSEEILGLQSIMIETSAAMVVLGTNPA